jgi:hypothetical protein
MGAATRIDDFTVLPSGLILPTDKVPVGRDNDGYQAEVSRMPQLWKRALVNIPRATDFATWANQNSAVLTDKDDGLQLYHAGNANGANVSSALRALPAGTTWTVTLGIMRGYMGTRGLHAGLAIRDSNNRSNLFTWTIGNSSSYNVYLAASDTSITNVYTLFAGACPITYYRVRRSGSNLQFYISWDGVQYVKQQADRSTGDWFTGTIDQWGLYVNLDNTGNSYVNDGGITAFHWHETNTLI